MGQLKNLGVIIARMVWKPWSPPGGGETRYYEKKMNNDDIAQEVCQMYRMDALKPDEREWLDEQIECVRGNPDLFGPMAGFPHD